ncbi:non-specific lipid transfer protein GPI-anchored 13-like [Cornus florida]|uniref:non-specific lipid transfer protein GPI-anchored 13-like n=1 Tax=Cornus florida TaxID=4283 RepID=UPI0028A1F50F|nr:non-specific lipid transfer protein GPI-anchored 13-like [Cornus florida]
MRRLHDIYIYIYIYTYICIHIHTHTHTMGSDYIRVGLSLLMVSTLMSSATSDTAKDREECTQQLVGLATCLPYVGGSAKAPTPDCCSGLKQVLKSNKKCLCVIIEDRNDPELSLNINVTLALGLPSVCSAPANVSQCPELLHLAPNSTDAQVFYQFNQSSKANASSPVASANTTSANSSGTSGSNNSASLCGGRRWLGLEVVVGGVLLIWCFTPHLFI